MRLLTIICILQFGLISSVFPNTITVSGKVVDKETGMPVERVIVSLRQVESNRIISFAQTPTNGTFELRTNVPSDSLELHFSHIAYASQIHRIPSDNQPLLIELAVANFELREVVINPRSIIQRRDTITYLVSAFALESDRTIGDVLRRMPGVEVLETGEIKFQGQKLNRFYIEGSDLLGGRYGLATNNISHRDVASVEILENHQPIKVLEDVVFSTSPAMNIRLKESARSRWVGTIKGGAGIPELWTAEVLAMRFRPETQTFNTYKTNNTGDEFVELNVFFRSGDFASNVDAQLPAYVQISPSVASGIGNSRSIFNQTHSLTSNNLFKIGRHFDLISEFTGSLDRRESKFSSQIVHFLGEEQTLIEDKTEYASDFRQAFGGTIRLRSNQKDYYLNNNFSFNYDRSSPFVDVVGTFPNSQSADIENLNISNNFNILRRFGSNVFTFRSNNEYASKPQSLKLTKENQSPIHANVALSRFHSNNFFDYSFMIGNVRVFSPIRLQYQYRAIENQMDDEVNDLISNRFNLDITPSINYNIHNFRFDLSTNVFYQTLFLENRAHHFYGANPRFSLLWTASPRLRLGASIASQLDLPNENLFYHGRIVNNYRSQTLGFIDFETGRSTNFSANAEYRDILNAFFANLWINAGRRHHVNILGQRFEEYYILNYYYSKNYTTDMFSVSGSLSKGIESIRGIITVSPLFTRNELNFLRNGTLIPQLADFYSIRSRVSSRISNRANLTYEISFAYNERRIEGGQQHFSASRLSQSLNISYSLSQSLQISYRFDHYRNELSSNNHKNFILSDISASYTIGNRWELIGSVTNLFNVKYYSYFIESNLNTFYESYTIRPRNILVSATYRF